MGDGFQDLNRYRYRPKHSDNESFQGALGVYVLVSGCTLGLLAPLAVVVGIIHYVIWRHLKH